MSEVPQTGAFEEYCAFTVTREGVGQQGARRFGPWENELKARGSKKTHERKGRECVIVEGWERPDPDEVFDDG